MGVHKVSAFHPFIFKKSVKSTIIRNLAVPRHFVAYLVFISSIRVGPGPTNRGPTSLLALKIRTPVFATVVRIFRANNDVGPLFLDPGPTRILEINTR
jgi:hypothetical protein